MIKSLKKTFRASFVVTIPVLLGYISAGMAFGLLFSKAGFDLVYTIFISISVYAGAMQFIAVNLLANKVNLLEIGLITLFVNIRHIFYGLSFIDEFKKFGKKKFYLIFALTDETYSLLCAVKPPADVRPRVFVFAIAAFNQCYWILGSVLGAIAGSLLDFNTRGLDFAMTALFIVIFVEQWLSYSSHIPVVIGTVSAIGALMLFGGKGMILPAMLFITILLLIFRTRLEYRVDTEKSRK